MVYPNLYCNVAKNKTELGNLHQLISNSYKSLSIQILQPK